MKTKLYKLVSLLVLLSMLVVPVSAQYVPPAEDSSNGQAKGIGPVQQVEGVDLATPARYVVLLKDPSLVRYTGGIIGLNATNPTARGEAHLDVNSPDSQAYLAYLKAKRAAFLGEAEKLIQRGLQVDFNYDVVLNGLAVIITPLEAEKLAAMPGVRQVLRDTIEQVDTDAGPTWIGAPSIWNGDTTDGTESRGEGVIVGILDTGINFDHPSFADPGPVDAYDYPAPAGGYKGVCAVVGGPYENACNDKLIGAYSFTTETVTPEDAEGHGSHTASTVAGNVVNLTFMGVDTTISGVAPHAQVIAYDVCDPSGCSSAASVAAVQQAIIDGVNVINYSISGGRDPYNDMVELAFLDAFDAGVFVSASAGNLKTGEPSTNGMVSHVSPWVMTVAASSHNRKFTNAISVVSPVPPATFTDMGLLVGTSPIAFGVLNDVELVWAGKDTSSSTAPFSDNRQGCNAFPAGFFTGDVALIRRGVCTFAAKVDNAAAAGAVGVLIYADTRPPTSPAGLEATTIPSGFLYLFPADAAALAAFVDANAPVLIDISAFGRVLNDAWGDIKADFSYRGPNPAFDVLKPDITAPGLEILAAVADGVIAPDPDAEFELYQGTSMSAPHVAGSAALLASLHPTWTPAEIKSALMLTTKNWDELLKENGTTQADPFDFGSGRVNLTNAALTGLVMDETTANFEAADPALAGDPTTLNLASLNSGQCVGACSFTRTFTSVAAGPAIYTVSVDAPAGMTITVSPATFTIPAGGTQEVTFDVDVAAMTADVWAFATVYFNTDNTHPGGAPTVLLSEGFETTTMPPTGWTRIEVDGSIAYQWTRSTTQFHSGVGSAYHSYGNGSVTEDGWLITPAVAVGTQSFLSFWERTAYPADYAGHFVYVCNTTNDCSTPPTNWVLLSETGALTNTSWRNQVYDLSAYTGQTVQVAFVYTGNYADGWYIDDVSINDYPAGEPISGAHIPVAVMPTTGNLPALVKFDSYRDAGAEVIPDLQAVAITDLTVDTYGFVKADLTQINLAQDPTNDLPYDDLSQVYYQMIPIPDGAARFVAEITSSTAPDLDLFWGYDSNGNGMPDAGEQLGSSATGTAFEYVSDVWLPALPNSLWVLVQNWEGSGSPTDAITLAIGVVPYDPIVPPTMTVDGPASNPAGNLFDLTVYWHDIDTQEGDRLYGIFDIYTDDTYTTNVGYTEVDVIRKADDVTKTADKDTTFVGDTITYTITVAPNMTAADLAYTLKDTIPAGFLYVPGSVTGGATYNAVDNAIEWSGVMPGSTARQYVYTTSAEDPNCTLEIMADGTPNAYLDWKTTSYGFSTSSTISGDSFWYSTFSTYPAFNYYGTNYTGMHFTADGYAMFAGASPSAVNQMIPDPTLPNNVMAMMWDDLVVTYDAATNKGVTMVGDSATFATIEYDDVALKSDPTKTLDFEIGYYLQPDDTPGAYEIIFAYDNISDGFFTVATATVGVENNDGTQGTLVSYNDPILTIASGSAICFDWVPIVPEAKVITYQVKADGSMSGEIVNNVEHDNDATGSVPETASFPVVIYYRFVLPIILTNP